VARPAPVEPQVAPAARSRPGIRPIVLPLLAALLALCAGAAVARRVARRAPPIIDGDALLRDDTDLLRERPPAHRARVHDDRGRHPEPAPQAAWGGDLLPDRRRRARDEGLAGRRGAGPARAGVRGPDRGGVARAADAAERRERLLHPDERRGTQGVRP